MRDLWDGPDVIPSAKGWVLSHHRCSLAGVRARSEITDARHKVTFARLDQPLISDGTHATSQYPEYTMHAQFRPPLDVFNVFDIVILK